MYHEQISFNGATKHSPRIPATTTLEYLIPSQYPLHLKYDIIYNTDND